MKRLLEFLAALFVMSLVGATPAYAYLDSATISMALQMATGVVAGVLLFGRIQLARLASFFRRDTNREKSED